jgi:putative sporulation protein YyaC
MPLDKIHFLCIGTDRSTGDSLGPLVGTELQKLGFPNVVGTIDSPCHAMNLNELLSEIPEGQTIIAVDACLGTYDRVGKIGVKNKPLTPGAGVDKDLGKVGDYGIYGVVNVGGFMEYFVLANTRLSLVLNMAREIVDGICSKYNPTELLVAAGNEDGHAGVGAERGQQVQNSKSV